MSPPALHRYRAERLLRKEFAGLRVKVLGIVRAQLRAKGISLGSADLEACYAQAWQGLYAAVLGGEEVESPSAWLVLVTFRRAIDELRAADRGHAGGHARLSDPGLDVAVETGGAVSDPDFAGALDDRARLRHVLEGLRGGLSARECEAASLCYLQGLSRAEAATRLGISQARMRKLMEGAGPGRPGVAGKVGELLDTIRAGGWCEQQSSLMRAYAFGVLDPEGERHVLAVAHCRECPACRAYVASLRGLAAVLPPLPLRLVLGGGVGAASGATGGAGTAGAGSRAGAGGRARSAPGSRSGAGGRAGAASGARSGASGAVSAGWSGSASSLIAKLAVTGLVALGTGYAVLGSRAHGIPVTRPTGTTQSIPAAGALPQKPFAAPSTPVRRPHSRPHSTRSRTARSRQRRSSSKLRAAGEPVAREFSPERVHGEAHVPATAAPASSGHSGSAGGEFGFE